MLLLDAARWFLLVLLVYAPWAYGSTRPWAKDSISWMLVALWVLFAMGLVLRRRWPRVPWPILVFTPMVLLVGWGVALNAYETFNESTFSFVQAHQILADWPGAVDRVWAANAMRMITGLFAALWVVCDLAAHPEWRKRLIWTMAVTGVSIAALGLIQRATGAADIFWAHETLNSTFFATYRYHGNAGAFLNLVFPYIALFAIWAVRRNAGQMSRAFWCLAVILTACSAFVNISRAAMAITAVLAAVLFGWQYWLWMREPHVERPIYLWTIPIVGVLVVAALGWAFGLEHTIHQWGKVGDGSLLENQRLIVYGVISDKVLPGIGCFGFGPGTFQIIFPFYTDDVASQIPGIWKYAHEDYLQTLVEWGWIGGILWAGLIFGGIGMAIWRLSRYGTHLSSEVRAVIFVSLLSLGGVLVHALCDFPLQIASLRLYAICALGLCWSIGSGVRPKREPIIGMGYRDPSKAPAPEKLLHRG